MVYLSKSTIEPIGRYSVEMYTFEPNDPVDADIKIEIKQFAKDSFMAEYLINKDGQEYGGLTRAHDNKAAALLHVERCILRKLKEIK